MVAQLKEFKEEYCRICGHQLVWRERRDETALPGWICDECNLEWDEEDHTTDITALVERMNELETRLAQIEQELGL